MKISLLAVILTSCAAAFGTPASAASASASVESTASLFAPSPNQSSDQSVAAAGNAITGMRPQNNLITLALAMTMADAAQAAAVGKNLKIVISIFDNHGNLKYFRRMDGTSVGSVQVSQRKASTSSQFPISTKVLAERSANLPANPYAAIPDFLPLEGGLPVMTSLGEHVGSIGVSGATPEMDAACAQAGVDAFLR